MQSVSAAFTAEEKDSVRSIVQNTQISWHRESTLGNITFTIGVSLIGGNDVIGVNPGSVAGPGAFKYFDESDYVAELSWEHGLSQPIGGINKSLASIGLDNTSGRFTPRFMGGNSELYTAILPSRPVIINAGFNFGGVGTTLPQFAGVLDKSPTVDMSERSVKLEAADYINYFQNKFIDRSGMFTGVRTDTVIESLLSQLGMSTSQYSLDQGINIIPFAWYDNGTTFADAIKSLVESENGQFYQDESGIFRFENRQHWDNSPYNSVQRIVLTGQVINAKAPNTDHIINVVEVTSNPRVKATTTIYTLSGTITLNSGVTEIFVDFDNPVLAASDPVYSAFSNEDGTGTNLTSSVSVKVQLFAKSAKYTFTNSSSLIAYITSMTTQGRWAVPRYADPLYTRVQDSSSLTAYQERPLSINNDYIQDTTWAESYANLVLTDYAEPENIQVIVIRAIPELQRGDLISWQGRNWRVYKIRTTLDPSNGYIQELTMIQRTLTTYFRIGVSTIGGSDKIAS